MRGWGTPNVHEDFGQRHRQEGQKSLSAPKKKEKRSMLYTREHTWAKVTSQGHVKVGLCEFPLICKQLKEITHVSTESMGEKVKQMEPFGAIETWDSVLDMYTPVSGKLKRINGRIRDDPNLLLQDPYGSGWIAEIDPINLEKEMKNLLNFVKYEEHCKELCLGCPKKNCTLSSASF